MYIRFTTQFRNETGDHETGVFQAAAYLRRHPDTYHYDVKLLDEIIEWFNINLERPTRFSKSRHKNSENVSLSWYKNTAHDHIQKMYDMKAILEKYDIVVEAVKRENPGNIIYEDEIQVSALPFRTDRSKVI
ncbi:MAG: hypothetical protein SF052_19400 [Bacteroidia bacterium]|nr:hypothetical protein [Bacteroidia bacterium]